MIIFPLLFISECLLLALNGQLWYTDKSLALGVLTAFLTGKPTNSALAIGVSQANRVAISTWPVVFAAIMAQALRMYASYKAERGVKLIVSLLQASYHSTVG